MLYNREGGPYKSEWYMGSSWEIIKSGAAYLWASHHRVALYVQDVKP